MEISQLGTGEGRRGSKPSQSNGRCFNSTFLPQFVAMGAAQAVRQVLFIQGELSWVYGVQPQSAPATPVHQVPRGQRGKGAASHGRSKEQSVDEEQRKSANREDLPFGIREFATEGFRLLLFFYPTQLPSDGAGKGDGGEFSSPRGREETRGGQSAAKGEKRRPFNSKDKISVATWTVVNGRCCTLAEI